MTDKKNDDLLEKVYNLVNGAKLIADKSETEEMDAIANILESALNTLWRVMKKND